MKGVSAILHTASPATLHAKNPQGKRTSLRFLNASLIANIEVIEPAVSGTVNILKSALKNGWVVLLFDFLVAILMSWQVGY